MKIVKVCWSGGKDSTTAVLKHIERGDIVKVCYYIPMFNEEIPLIQKEHYEFIVDMARRFEDMGAETYRANGITYIEYITHIAKCGKYKGLPFGFPSINRGQCGFKRDSKEKSIKKIDCGYYDYESIGIAYDEPKRFANLSETTRSILVELGITEKQCFDFCKENDCLSPQYLLSNRDGCVLCPHAKQQEREKWFNDYPKAVDIIKEMQSYLLGKKPWSYPLRNYKMFVNNDGSIN